MKLPITLLPNVDPPIVSVVVTRFGAAPGELEQQVTQPIENAVAGVRGVKHVISSIGESVSATTVTFALDANADKALADVKAAISRMRSTLPSGISEPQVKRVDAVGLSILTYAAMSQTKTPAELSAFVDAVVMPKLHALDGISSVERMGGVQPELRVALDADKLQAADLTAAEVNQQLVEARAHATTAAELAATKISLTKGGTLRLDQLATVSRALADPHRFARLDKQPIVAFSIVRAKGASDVTVADKVDAALHQVEAQNPGVNIKLIDTSVNYTKGNFDSALHTFFEGAALAVIVVFLFLRDLRATVIAAIALPLSIIPAFWVMSLLGFSLNLVSLLAVTLATGILVDDAIVEIENIVRHMRMGKSAYQAAIDAADEIGLAVIAISLTIVAVFAPVSFISNVAGQYFKQFGLTIAAEVLFSLLAARLITPMLAAHFMKGHPEPEVEGGLTQRYGKLVEWSVLHRYKTVVIGLALFACSILSITTNLVSRDFQPTQDSSRSHLAIELPANAKLADTEKATDQVTDVLRKYPEVTSVFTDGGRIAPGAPEVRKAQLTVNYVDKAERKRSVLQLQAAINKDLDAIPGIAHWFVDDYGARPVSRIFTGQDGAAVERFAADLAREMKKIPLITNIVAMTALERSQLKIKPDHEAMSKLGVAQDSINETIRIATIGDAGAADTDPDGDHRLLPVRTGLDDKSRANPQFLGRMMVPSETGNGVPLGAVAQIAQGDGPVSISRYDRARAATIQADLVDGAAVGDVDQAVNRLPLMQHLPQGVQVRMSASSEAMGELSGGFTEAMRNGLIMVYVVLVLLFASFLQPITILFSLPLSIGGAILALIVTGRPLSMPVIIGILMLMGIVTKNAIMLVDFSTSAMARGVPRTEAVIEAGKKRARPIIMTTIAMVAGMVPSALGFGAGAEFRSPMAIAVIGGLIVSTLLSLLFVPAVFAVMDDARIGVQMAWGAVTARRKVRTVGKRPARVALDPEAARGPAE